MARLRSWWQKIQQHPRITAVIIVAGLLGIVLIVALIGGYIFNWPWTGLGPYTPPTKDSNFQRGKTLWDWLQLLGVFAIPLAVGLGTVWFTTKQHQTELQIAENQQRETLLQDYLDRMSELLLKEGLRTIQPNDEVVLATSLLLRVLERFAL
jgi:hypothetical protein